MSLQIMSKLVLALSLGLFVSCQSNHDSAPDSTSITDSIEDPQVGDNNGMGAENTPAKSAETTPTEVEPGDEVGALIAILESDQDRGAKALAAAELSAFPAEIDRFAEPLSKLLTVRDEVLNDTAARVFESIGKPGVEALSPDFKTPDLDHLRRVCSAINAVGDEGQEYQPALLAILKSEDDMFRRTAATFALTGFSNGCPEAIDLILPDLDHRDMNVTLFASRLIAKTGEQARQAAPKLIDQLENGIVSQRGHAILALAAIGDLEDFDTVAAVGKMLNRFTVSERERGLLAAGMLGPKAAPFVDRVKEMMAAEQSNIEGRAAVTLWKITGDAETSVQRIIELIGSDVFYEINGLLLLAEMGPAASTATEFLIQQLDHSDAFVRIAAVDALKAIGGDATESWLRLEQLANNDPDALVRLAAKQAITMIPKPTESELEKAKGHLLPMESPADEAGSQAGQSRNVNRD